MQTNSKKKIYGILSGLDGQRDAHIPEGALNRLDKLHRVGRMEIANVPNAERVGLGHLKQNNTI
jgi:hypothetical protein